MLKRFMAYYKPHKLLFFFDMLASLAVAAIAITYPMITRTMLNTYIPDNNIRMVVICGGALLCVYLLRMGLNYFIQYYGHVMGVKMQPGKNWRIIIIQCGMNMKYAFREIRKLFF